MLRKLHLNVFSWRAYRVLGVANYLKYLFLILANLPMILRTRDFKPLDRVMGSKAIKIRYDNTRFIFDCKYCDNKIKDGTFAFGGIREIYIRDCYFKLHKTTVFPSIKTVLDLGANRGMFSTMMASRAEKVISVEVLPEFGDVIEHNMKLNGFRNYAIECAFVGEGGKYSGAGGRTITLPELLDKYSLQSVDMIKLDIEGSEFALFESPSWLERVRYISMEVHPEYGDVVTILRALNRYGLRYKVVDHMFRPVCDANKAEFVYAYRD